MKFVDEVKIWVRSGRGGDGCGSLLREANRPRGGPDGGDGGDGGSVMFVAERNLSTLLDFRYTRHYRAEHGQNGMSRQKYGRKGKDCTIRVPVGTVISDNETGEVLADLTENEAVVVAVPGGKGGKGNMHFATSTNQAPRQFERGEEAVERELILTLKLLADVGLVGFPNAGKSTFISRISAAKPKVADYPFTTLSPNLGMVRLGYEEGFVVADIPGLIEGASEGAGLGHRFLKHVERVSVLAFVLSVSYEEGRTPEADYEVLVRELEHYDADLARKPRMILLAKADLPDTAEHEAAVRALAERDGAPFFVISSVTGQGLDAVVRALNEVVVADRAARAAGLDEDGTDADEDAFDDEDDAYDDEDGDEDGDDELE
ncbi:MAG: GTPase ObgE [Deltaproteobacteria bacterium]|nr:GTPase ObgE [Deltaproteobacteria bacterium]